MASLFQIHKFKIIYIFILFTETHTTDLFKVILYVIRKDTYLKILLLDLSTTIKISN